MSIFNPDGSVKPTRQIMAERKIRLNKLATNKEKRDSKNYHLHGIRVSDLEWERLDKAISKLNETSPTGAVKQSVINNIFKEFNDKILGGVDNENNHSE